jgi:hypothetical protein
LQVLTKTQNPLGKVWIVKANPTRDTIRLSNKLVQLSTRASRTHHGWQHLTTFSCVCFCHIITLENVCLGKKQCTLLVNTLIIMFLLVFMGDKDYLVAYTPSNLLWQARCQRKKKTQPLKGEMVRSTPLPNCSLWKRFGYLVSANWNQLPLWMIVEVVDRWW